MPQDVRVGAYIDRAAPFAQPILGHIRDLVHKHMPDAGETIKWGMPFFELAGRQLAMMAAFKAHVGLGIFDGSLMSSSGEGGGGGMGQFGKIASIAGLPPDTEIAARLRAAAEVIAAGKPTMRPRAAPKPPAPVPDDLAAALDGIPAAAAGFAALPPGAQREYVDWVVGAKQATTRSRRIEATVAQVAEGKKLNWRYENC